MKLLPIKPSRLHWLVLVCGRSDWWTSELQLERCPFPLSLSLAFSPLRSFFVLFLPFIGLSPTKARDLTANKRWQILNSFLISTHWRWVTWVDGKASLLYRQRWENPINSMTNSAGRYWPPSCFALPSLQRAREGFTGKLNWPLATSGRMRNKNNFLKEFQTVMPGVSGRGQRI